MRGVKGRNEITSEPALPAGGDRRKGTVGGAPDGKKVGNEQGKEPVEAEKFECGGRPLLAWLTKESGGFAKGAAGKKWAAPSRH